jgi:hypothetical protein
MAKTAASKTPAKTAAKTAAKTTVKAAAVKTAAPRKTPGEAAVRARKAGTAAKSAAPAVKPQAKAKPEAEAKEKSRKEKLVRDSFTMPEAEYQVLGDVKKTCLKAGIDVKKSELLRVGVALIRQLDTARLKEILGTLPTLKAGRPKKSK